MTNWLTTQATRQAQHALTQAHGEEAQTVIQHFESKWGNLDSHQNPSGQSELATEQYLGYLGYARFGETLNDEPWLVTKQATVETVKVLAYAPERFKAVARVILLRDKITPTGKFIESMPSFEKCGVYVFIRSSGPWKLATYFNMNLPLRVEQFWADQPSWSKELIGDLPEYECD